MIWHVVTLYARQIGIPDLAPHDLRRTCAKLCRSSGGDLLVGLKAVEVIHGALGKRGSLEDGPGVVLQNLEPGRDVGGVVFLDFRGDFEIGAKESRAQLGHEFLAGIAFVAPGLAAEVPVEARRMFGAMDAFVRESRVEAFGIAEAFDGRELDVVGFLRVVGPAPAIPDVGLRSGEEPIGVLDSFNVREPRLGLGVVVLRQAFDLLDVEHGVALHERNLALDLAAFAVVLSLDDGIGIDDE